MSQTEQTYPCWAVILYDGDPPAAVFEARRLDDAVEMAKRIGARVFQASSYAVFCDQTKDWAK